MFLLEKLEDFPFSESEKLVVDYILSEGEGIADLTIEQIANETFTSKSTLVRIGQKLGFKGWVDFKKHFLEETNYFNRQLSAVDANIPFNESDNSLQIANKIAILEKEAIDDTLSLLTIKQLNQVVDIINKSQTIHLFAASNNLLNAQEFGHNLARIQKDVRVHQLHGEVLFNAYLSKENTCAIIISYSGGTESLIKVSHILKRKKIPIIAITSIGDNPINQLANVTIRLATKEKLYSKIGTFSTDMSITYVLDVIYSLVFSKDYKNNLKLRQLSSKVIENERSSKSSVLREE